MVTGASRGIGRCAALALAKRGFDVVITARTVHEGDGRVGNVVLPGSLDKTAEEISDLGARVLVVPMDVTDRDSIRDAFDETIAAWGRLDVLVNNAPYSGPGTDARVLDIDLGVAARILEANHLNQLLLVQLALPGMLERGRGTIVNLGSGSAAYCASKAALHQVAVVVDVEFRQSGIRCFTVEPGYTVTERALALHTEDAYAAHFHGDPPEVAGEVIGWLATEDDGDRFLGRIVHAQALCRKYNLVPGWS